MTEPAMVAMSASAILSAICCLRARSAVPWQGRQSVIVMAVVMIGLTVTGADPGAALLAGAVLVASAMLGTMGLRGTTAVRDCCHRSLGSVVMALCAFAAGTRGGGGGGQGAIAALGHSPHGVQVAGDPVAVLAAVGVALLVGWTCIERARPHQRRNAARMHALESWAMTAGIVVMWAAH